MQIVRISAATDTFITTCQSLQNAKHYVFQRLRSSAFDVKSFRSCRVTHWLLSPHLGKQRFIVLSTRCCRHRRVDEPIFSDVRAKSEVRSVLSIPLRFPRCGENESCVILQPQNYFHRILQVDGFGHEPSDLFASTDTVSTKYRRLQNLTQYVGQTDCVQVSLV